MPEITLRSLIADYVRDKMADEVGGDWGSLVFYRPLGFFLTWPLARFGIAPIAVTISGLLLLPVIATVAVIATPDMAAPVVCLLGALFCVLDCMDGTLARALKRESKLGHYIDISADIMYRPVIYAALGHIADRLVDSTHQTSLTLALVAAWLALFARVVRLYNDKLLTKSSASPSRSDFTASSLIRKAHLALSGIDSLLPFLALILWWLGLLNYLFIWLLIYSAADAIYIHAITLWALRKF